MCIALMVDPRGDPEILKAQNDSRSRWRIDPEKSWPPRNRRLPANAYTLADRTRWPQRWSVRNRGDHEGYVAGYSSNRRSTTTP